MISNLARFCLGALTALAMFTGFLIVPLSVGEGTSRVDSAQKVPVPERMPLFAPDQAVAMAINDLKAIADGYRLRHPRYTVTFTPHGLQFTPWHGGPEWAWQLAAVSANDVPLSEVTVGTVRPVNEQPLTVDYLRGALVERYLAQKGSIEQQFLVPRPLPLGRADLVIAGMIRSAGTFEATEGGWRWRTPEGAVCLGRVRAYDAAGRDLPATMEVSATATRIVVDGDALARAAYPVTIDPQVGANDFRLSDMGPNAYDSYSAFDPAVAYNSTNDEYLVVWEGDDDTGGLVEDEFEIFGQRVNAATGAEVGVNDFRLSDMGSDGDAHLDAACPAVAYNSKNNEYLVVWVGDDVNDLEPEIFGQRVNAATGAQVGVNDFRLSDMGPEGSPLYLLVGCPAVAYNSTNNEYLVVWNSPDDTLVFGDREIFGQRVNAATGAQAGENDFCLSDMGPHDKPPDSKYNAANAAVAYNSTNNEYLVVWQGEDGTGEMVNDEWEIFGQRVNAATGAQVGVNDFRLSDMGPDGDSTYDAQCPAVAYNSTNNEYLVVWEGDDNSGGVVNEEFEIFGQRVNAATGAEAGVNDFRLSDMGPDGYSYHHAHRPAVAYDGVDNEYLVVWFGNDNAPPLYFLEDEVYGQRVAAATGAQTGANDFRLSDMGPDGSADYYAGWPAVAYNGKGNQYLVVWQGEDDTPPLEAGEDEIFGQRFAVFGNLVYLPLVLRNK